MNRFDRGIGKAPVNLARRQNARWTSGNGDRRESDEALHPPPLKRRMKFIFMNSSVC
jgi:hypothetical protein